MVFWESCHLDLESEEADDVVFSVIGRRSVYRTGYYVSNDPRTKSYGEDNANRETDESGRHSDEDDYEDSFINDGNAVVFPFLPDGEEEGCKAQGFKVGENDCRVTVERSDSKADYGTSGHVSKGKAEAITNKELKRSTLKQCFFSPLWDAGLLRDWQL
ncbi:hypothetical protein ACH5RR_000316 [Cinchona calisaya]|uniref:Uncharacterized protein n=1 Tax=Cinchona calisaya TaxID=153742 RepID=A0ABD3B093_9GENT